MCRESVKTVDNITHAAAWVVMAFAKMGDGEKAMELFDLFKSYKSLKNPY